MSEGTRGGGPYHSGELEVQRRAGVVEDAGRVGRMVGATLSPMAQSFLAEQRMAVAASLDESGRVWASLLSGPLGFLRAIDDELLVIENRLPPSDPLVANLAVRRELGLLAIDLAERRRLRVNGRGLLDDDRIFLTVEKAYGNCPKYIRPRRVEPLRDGAFWDRRATSLDAGQRGWIAGADCFFIASHHPDGGADASHRGGPPGFVTVGGPTSLSFPDYPGNNMFNTLGNVQAQPRVGLLFLDFETGGTLRLTGRASLEWNGEGEALDFVERRAVVSFELDLAEETRGRGVVGRIVA